MKKLIVGSILAIILAFNLTSCSEDNDYNPFVCHTNQKALTEIEGAKAVSVEKVKQEVLDNGKHLGEFTLNPTNFTLDTNLITIIEKMKEKVQPGDVLVVYTNIDTCNDIQQLYALYVVRQLAHYGFNKDNILFVDAKTNNVLKDSKEMSLTIDFIVVKKDQL